MRRRSLLFVVAEIDEADVGGVQPGDRKQARVIFRYIEALIDGTPMLARMVVGRTKTRLT
jgi:hypothetical protein